MHCRKRYVPSGRTVRQTCPHCWNETPRKKATLSACRKLADQLCSLVVRLDAADEAGNVFCVTCGRKMHYTEAHAGHFVERACDEHRYNRINVNPQCPRCNTFSGGMPWEYGQWIDEQYGAGTAAALKANAGDSKYKRKELLQIAKDFLEEAYGLDEEEAKSVLARFPAVAVEMEVPNATQ